MEIMQAAGGSESSLFANELVGMYQNYARMMGFRWEELEFQEDIAITSGCKKGVFKVTG